jgi:methylmalonyl-CoA mutase, N-terminal domain
VVGVNRFATGDATDIEVLRIDPELERSQIERVRDVRASRAEAEWAAAMEGIVTAARSTGNLVPPIVRAVEARATVGEISDALRSVFGEHKEIDA